jgi:hypothetical protein
MIRTVTVALVFASAMVGAAPARGDEVGGAVRLTSPTGGEA